LHINDATGISRIRLTGGAAGADNFEIGQGVLGVTNEGFSIYDVDATANRLVIDGSGRVGIGTTSPSVDLHVSNASGARIRAGGASGAGFEFNDANTRLDIPVANTIAVYTGASERARIDSSGRLLVGTSSAVAAAVELLQIAGVAGNTASPGGIALTRASVNNTDDIGFINFSNRSAGAAHAQIKAICDGTPGTNDYPGALVFSTTADGASSPTERMRIHSTGTTSLSYGLTIGTSGDGGATKITFGNSVIASGAGTNALKWNSSNGFVTYDTSSRLIKENIENCPYGIDAIKQLQPRKYFRTDDQRNEIGFVADEVVAVLPEFVPVGAKSIITKDDADTEEIPLGVNYDKLTAVLTKALQEAIAKIETLEAKVAALEAA
jgi:hypothetical protein